MKTPTQSFFYDQYKDPRVRAQHRAYNKLGLKWPPKKKGTFPVARDD